ncbi:MAG: TdeIII family type II restriction endonuclease [Nanoarchaeota archaeon]|nr:TdeIII family type II restriction endonuclease [Nanoarchaeota archaeon]
MTLNQSLKKELKEEITKKLKKKISEHNFSKKSGNPFIDIIFGKYSNIKSFIHGTATMLGSEYEIMARKIAKSNPKFIKAEKIVLTGKISDNEKAVIKDLVKDLEEKKTNSDYDFEIKKVFEAENKNLKETRITIDLYLQDKKYKEFFIEMKGPDPNKKEVRAAKEDLLNVVAIKKKEMKLNEFNQKIEIMFGIYYNNNEGKYNNWKVSPLFEENKGIKVQEEFWNFLGGENTFKDILEMISEIKKEIYPLIKKKIESLN